MNAFDLPPFRNMTALDRLFLATEVAACAWIAWRRPPSWRPNLYGAGGPYVPGGSSQGTDHSNVPWW